MNRNWRNLALTSALGVALSYSFVFLAALPLRYLRLNYGRNTFMAVALGSTMALAAVGNWQWSMIYFSLCFLIGSYRELEEKDFSIFLAATITVFATAGANLFALFGYTKWTGQTLNTLLLSRIEPLYKQLQEMPRFQGMELNQVIWYLPSGLIVTLMIIVFVSLTVSRTSSSTKTRLEMRGFRLPEWLIWVFIGSLAATFVQTSSAILPVVGSNILFVTLAAYFFQGLSVFTYFLDRLSIFGFWRMLAYFLIFFQMFAFVSGLGILDYWFDFRTKNLPKKKKFNS